MSKQTVSFFLAHFYILYILYLASYVCEKSAIVFFRLVNPQHVEKVLWRGSSAGSSGKCAFKTTQGKNGNLCHVRHKCDPVKFYGNVHTLGRNVLYGRYEKKSIDLFKVNWITRLHNQELKKLANDFIPIHCKKLLILHECAIPKIFRFTFLHVRYFVLVVGGFAFLVVSVTKMNVTSTSYLYER